MSHVSDLDILAPQFIRDHYAVRFPELEQIIADPWDYINAVRSIGNAQDLTKPETPLTGRHGLGVSMTASISRGRVLTPEEWDIIVRACQVASDLRDAREKVSRYVGSRGMAELSKRFGVRFLPMWNLE